MKLKGQRIIVLGGTSGIGFAVAKAAAAEEANVVIVSSKPERVTNAIASLPKGAQGGVVDLTNEEDVERFFLEVGAFDHLVYTAGDWALFGDYATLSLADAKHSFDVRFWGCLAAIKYALPHIKHDGSIVLTSGTSGRRPSKGWAIPSSILGGVEALGRALAVELGPLRVNVVCPGMTKTEMWDELPKARWLASSRLVGWLSHRR
jgi:NAD(P)-dependent dehydrogenase (short-subunit alcohol dehydrogenase family)